MEMSDRVRSVDEAVQCDKAYLSKVGLYKLTHSLKEPAFNP
jgi:hypothetical protein